MRLKLFSMLILVAGLISCVSAPKAPSGSPFRRAQWETKLRIKDLREQKTRTLSVDVLAEKGGPFRMEASALLGYPIASYVMDQTGFRCAVYPQKSFYEGPLTENSLRPLIKVALSPRILGHIAFDEPVSDKGWTCRFASNGAASGLVESCQSQRHQTSIQWDRHETGKTVKVRGPQFEIDWFFEHPRTEVQFSEGTFALETPANFRVIRL